MGEYFTGKVNLGKIKDLSNYLVEQNFKSNYIEHTKDFPDQFNPNVWKNEKIGLYLHIHSEEENIFIKTQNNKSKLESQKDLIKKIMETVEIEEIFHVWGEPVKGLD